MKRAVIIPDSHHGGRRSPDGHWEPLHDEKACSAALEVVAAVRPNEVILLGDMLDLAEQGRFTVTPDLMQTTQRSLEELHSFLVRLRDVAGPNCKITYLQGNHEQRLERKLLEDAPCFVDLKAIGSNHKVLSVPNLLGLDELKIDYVSPYGAVYWLWGQVSCAHGDILRKHGTASTRLMEQPFHQCFGHGHVLDYSARTIHTASGPKTLYAMSPGTLARIDGVVPAGTASVKWSQGVGVVCMDSDKDIFMTMLPIVSGKVKVRLSY